MTTYKWTFTMASGWTLFWGVVRLASVVLVAFNAPAWVTMMYVVAQLRFEMKTR